MSERCSGEAMTFPELVDFMKKNRVLRAQFGGFVAELHPSAFTDDPAAPPAGSDQPTDEEILFGSTTYAQELRSERLSRKAHEEEARAATAGEDLG